MQTTHAAFGQCPFYKGPYPRQQQLLFPPARQQHRTKSTAHGRGDKNSGGGRPKLEQSHLRGVRKVQIQNAQHVDASCHERKRLNTSARGSWKQTASCRRSNTLNFRLKIHKKMLTASKCTNRHSFNCASKCRRVVQIPKSTVF